MAYQASEFDYQRLMPRTLEDLLIGWMSRICGAALVALCTALWLSLLTWSAADLDRAGAHPGSSANLLGPFGATVSDLLLQTVGLACVFLLVCIFIWGLRLLLTERIDRFQVRAFFAVIALIGIAGGSSALPTAGSWAFLNGYGGILGDLSFNLVAGLFAQLRVTGSGLIAGTALFGLGIWAFCCAIGLDREHLFEIVLSPRRLAAQHDAPTKRRLRELFTLRRGNDRDSANVGEAASDLAAVAPSEIVGHQRIEPKFQLSSLTPSADTVPTVHAQQHDAVENFNTPATAEAKVLWSRAKILITSTTKITDGPATTTITRWP